MVPQRKKSEFFFSSIFKKKVSIAQNWKKVSIYDEFELVWDELIILEKKSEKNLNFFLAIFRKKGLKWLWIKNKGQLWWIWAYLRWIGNFWKKKIKKIFLKFFLWGTKGRKSNSYGPPKEKIWIFFSSIFRKKKISIALNIWKKF